MEEKLRKLGAWKRQMEAGKSSQKRDSTPIESTVGTEYIQLRRGIFLAAADLQQILRSVEQVSEAITGFRRTCDLSELRGAKKHTAELRTHLQIVKNKIDEK